MENYKYIDEKNDDNDDEPKYPNYELDPKIEEKKHKREKINVFVRIRPFIQYDLDNDDSSPIIEIDTKNNSIISK